MGAPTDALGSIDGAPPARVLDDAFGRFDGLSGCADGRPWVDQMGLHGCTDGRPLRWIDEAPSVHRWSLVDPLEVHRRGIAAPSWPRPPPQRGPRTFPRRSASPRAPAARSPLFGARTTCGMRGSAACSAGIRTCEKLLETVAQTPSRPTTAASDHHRAAHGLEVFGSGVCVVYCDPSEAVFSVVFPISPRTYTERPR